MQKLFKLSILLLITFYINNTQANRHEHFTSWPLSSAIIDSYQETYRQPIGNLQVEDLLQLWPANKNQTKEEIIHLALKTIYTKAELDKLESNLGIPADSHPKEKIHLLGKSLSGKSINFLVSNIFDTDKNSIDHEEAMKRLFKFQKDTPKGDNAYIVKETIRQKLFNKIKKTRSMLGPEEDQRKFKQFLIGSFTKTSDRLPKSSSNFIGVSVSPAYFNEDLADLKKALKAKGDNMDFYMSITRNIIVTEKERNKSLEKALKKVRNARKQGWGDGVDITGSITEQRKELSNKQIKNTAKAFREIALSLGGSNDTLLRIHAFEATNQGSFYKELFKFADELASGQIPINGKPPVLSIGHIAALSDLDIERFSEIRDKAKKNGIPFKIVFDANVVSNLEVQGVTRNQILENIKKLDKAGFEVGVGSDGTGILGKESSVKSQISVLRKEGLPFLKAYEIQEVSNKRPVCDINYLDDLIQGGAF